MPKTITVTAADIQAGIAGDCYSCPVALALTRVYGIESAPNVYETLDGMRVEVWAQSVVAPWQVREFVWDFDRLERSPSGQVVATEVGILTPFTFELPEETSPEWQEKCYYCEELCNPQELNEEGICPDCKEKDNESAESDADVCGP